MGIGPNAITGVVHIGNHMHTPGRHVGWGNRNQARVPVNAAAFVPPAFELGRINAHDQQVVRAGFCDVGDVVAKTGVPAEVAAQEMTVKPHLAVAVNAVELEPQPAARVGGGNRNRLAIPGRFDRQVTVRFVRLRIERAFDNVIMWNVDGCHAESS